MTFRTRHWRHVVVVGLFVMTGLGLFLTTWRTALGSFLPLVQDIHEFGGVLYGIALVGWSLQLFPWPAANRRGAPAYTKWAYFFLLLLALTGVGLLIGPSWTHAIATVGHAAAAAAFVLWTAWHLLKTMPIRRVAVAKPEEMGPWDRFRVSRRGLIRWGAGVVLAVPAVLAMTTMVKVVSGRLLGAAGGTTAGALPGFVPYTVVNGYPKLSEDTWTLTLEGLATPKKWTWAQWQKEPQRHITYDFRCVTGWAVNGVKFSGVDLHDWLLRQGWDPARHPWVLFYSGDGVYTESLSAKQVQEYRPLLASTIDGQPLPVSQGYPMRLLVPGMYGYKSIKWLVRVKLAPNDVRGYWEVRGYPENAFIGAYTGQWWAE